MEYWINVDNTSGIIFKIKAYMEDDFFKLLITLLKRLKKQ